MEVKVTWRSRNPFCPRLEDLSRTATGKNIDSDTSFDTIEQWANEATPEGYWLYSIVMPDKTYVYSIHGELITEA